MSPIIQTESLEAGALLEGPVLQYFLIVLISTLVVELVAFALSHLKMREFIIESTCVMMLTDSDDPLNRNKKATIVGGKIKVKYPLFLVSASVISEKSKRQSVPKGSKRRHQNQHDSRSSDPTEFKVPAQLEEGDSKKNCRRRTVGNRERKVQPASPGILLLSKASS